MANVLYDKAREDFLGGSLDWLNNDVRAALIDTGNYTFSAAHLAFDTTTVPTAARIATMAAGLTSKTATAGVANAANVTFSAVTGASIEAIIIYKFTGTPANDRLIAYIDSATSGLPITPNGGDLTIAWSTGTSKIFKL